MLNYGTHRLLGGPTVDSPFGAANPQWPGQGLAQAMMRRSAPVYNPGQQVGGGSYDVPQLPMTPLGLARGGVGGFVGPAPGSAASLQAPMIPAGAQSMGPMPALGATQTIAPPITNALNTLVASRPAAPIASAPTIAPIRATPQGKM